MNKEFFYIPNILTFLRLLFLIPVCYYLIFDLESKKILIVTFLVIMFLTDLLDGYFARKLKKISELGKIIDPLADKVSVVSISIILLYLNKIPIWFVSVIVLRDLLILAFGFYLNNKMNIRLMSNIPGKITVFTIGLTILFSIINGELFLQINSFLMYITIILIIYSSYLYFERFYKTLEEQKNDPNRSKFK